MAIKMSVVSDEAMRYVIKRIVNKKRKDVVRVCRMADNLFSYPHGSTAEEFGLSKSGLKK